MTASKRSYEASGLRAFFDHQINHLETLFGDFMSRVGETEALSDEDKVLVENFVDAANNKMRVIDGYAIKLREYVRDIYAHVHQVADQIPPPIELSEKSFKENPLVNALFVNLDEIERVCKNQPDAARYLRSHNLLQVPIVYAALLADKHEKSTLGVGMLGNILVRDVPQQVVNFSAHKLHAFGENQEELIQEFKKYLFDNVVYLIKQQMALRISAEMLSKDANAYESRIKSLANPNVYLNAIIEYLRVPASLLSIEKAHFSLNKLGVKLTDAEMEYANEFDVHEIVWSNQNRNVVLHVFYAR